MTPRRSSRPRPLRLAPARRRAVARGPAGWLGLAALAGTALGLVLLASAPSGGAAAGPARPAVLYVAPDGDDAAPGTRARPLATIQAAVDRARPGDTVLVRGGTYRQTVRLRRSGRPEAPIRLMAAPGETVVLSGLDLLSAGWTRWKGRIWRARVREHPRHLFCDGAALVPARWPDMPWHRRWDPAVWAVAGEGSRYGLMVDPALARTGIDFTGGVATLNVGSWQTFRRVVRDHGPGRDRFAYRTDMPGHVQAKRRWAGFDRYFITGPLAALDAPGEWFYDAAEGTLYLWTPDGRPPAEHRLETKRRPYALEAEGVRHVEVVGLHLFGTTFKFERCEGCRLRFLHLAFPHGVFDPFGPPQGRGRHPLEPKDWLSRRWFGETSVVTPTFLGGEGNVLDGCTIRDADGAAVVVAGRRNTVENCLVHDDNWSGLDVGFGVDLLGCREPTLRRCTLFALGGSETVRLPNEGPALVEFNYIHHGGRCQSDGALVQTSSRRAGGIVIRYNWLHDHEAFNWGGNGIRGDDTTHGLLVHHNVVWRCRNKGIVVKGDYNRIYNNTCFDNPLIDLLVWSSPEPLKPWRGRPKEDHLARQNVHSEAMNNYAPVLSGRMPHEIRRAGRLEPPACRLANNYRPPAPMLLDAKALRFRDDEPLLADPARFDFRPKAGSPLVDAGRPVPGITDGYAGKAPDVGAYEFGGERWVPGYRSALWVLPDAGTGARMARVRVLLAMPPLEPVAVEVSAEGEGVTVSPRRLTFTPQTWCRPQGVAIRGRGGSEGDGDGEGGGKRVRLRFRIPAFEMNAALDLADLDPLEGARLPFRTIP